MSISVPSSVNIIANRRLLDDDTIILFRAQTLTKFRFSSNP